MTSIKAWISLLLFSALGVVSHADENGLETPLGLLLVPDRVEAWPNHPAEIRAVVYCRARAIQVLNPFFRDDHPFFGVIRFGTGTDEGGGEGAGEVLRRSTERGADPPARSEYQTIRRGNFVGATFRLVIKGSPADILAEGGPRVLRIPREAGSHTLQISLHEEMFNRKLWEGTRLPSHQTFGTAQVRVHDEPRASAVETPAAFQPPDPRLEKYERDDLDGKVPPLKRIRPFSSRSLGSFPAPKYSRFYWIENQATLPQVVFRPFRDDGDANAPSIQWQALDAEGKVLDQDRHPYLGKLYPPQLSSFSYYYVEIPPFGLCGAVDKLPDFGRVDPSRITSIRPVIPRTAIGAPVPSVLGDLLQEGKITADGIRSLHSNGKVDYQDVLTIGEPEDFPIAQRRRIGPPRRKEGAVAPTSTDELSR